MFKTKFHINIVLLVIALVAQVSTVFAAPALKIRPSVKRGLALAASTGWIVSCNYSHSLSDDPIVFPRQAGASHLHDFVGGRSTDAFSTGSTLISGGTTCAMPADKSGYWVLRSMKMGDVFFPWVHPNTRCSIIEGKALLRERWYSRFLWA